MKTGETCPVSAGMGGLVVKCDDRPGHPPPHSSDAYGISWTMPGEQEIPGVPTVFGADAISEAVRDAIARGITAEQIATAIRALEPEAPR